MKKLLYYIVIILHIIILASSSCCTSGDYSILLKDGHYSIVKGQIENPVAYGTWKDQMNETGWSFINVETYNTYSDYAQSYAAGYFEGYVTSDKIWNSWVNSQFLLDKNITLLNLVYDWLFDNYLWLNVEIADHPGDIYWQNVAHVSHRFLGMRNGYKKAMEGYPERKINLNEWLLINSAADVMDIIAQWKPPSEEEPSIRFAKRMHCSAYIKHVGDDLVVAHTTFAMYNSMIRIYKTFTFDYVSLQIYAKSVSYSSYPGYLHSGDDFFLTDKGLVATETTNDIFNISMAQSITHKSLLNWVRQNIAIWTAKTPSDWVNIYLKYNSGTNNNQWMVVDLYRFNKFGLTSDIFYIVEQLPGNYSEYADMTSFLANYQYWGSYNIPYFPSVYNISGYYGEYIKYGDEYSYNNCPRAKIFRRDYVKTKDPDSTKKLMQYNDYLHDELSLNNPGYSISARSDLVPHMPFPNGGVDSKIVWASYKDMNLDLKSGPTSDQISAFTWTDEKWKDIPHIGMPIDWNFEWIKYNPEKKDEPKSYVLVIIISAVGGAIILIILGIIWYRSRKEADENITYTAISDGLR